MFFFFGIMNDQKDLNFHQPMTCTQCGRMGQYQVFVTYMVLSIFFIPICTSCDLKSAGPLNAVSRSRSSRRISTSSSQGRQGRRAMHPACVDGLPVTRNRPRHSRIVRRPARHSPRTSAFLRSRAGGRRCATTVATQRRKTSSTARSVGRNLSTAKSSKDNE